MTISHIWVQVKLCHRSGSVIKAALGGKLPGASLPTPGTTKFPEPFYTPIAGGLNSGFAARPLFYGMMLAGQLAGAIMVETKLDTGGANVTAYAARAAGKLRVAIFNKDLTRAVQVNLVAGRAGQQARLWRLAAPPPDSTEGVTLTGAEAGNDGRWQPARGEGIGRRENGYPISLPPGSAALVFLDD